MFKKQIYNEIEEYEFEGLKLKGPKTMILFWNSYVEIIWKFPTKKKRINIKVRVLEKRRGKIMNKFSIIIPIFNCEKYMKNINSILIQTFKILN